MGELLGEVSRRQICAECVCWFRHKDGCWMRSERCLALNLWSSCLHLSNSGVTGMSLLPSLLCSFLTWKSKSENLDQIVNSKSNNIIPLDTGGQQTCVQFTQRRIIRKVNLYNGLSGLGWPWAWGIILIGMRQDDPPWTWAVPFPGLGPGLNEEGVRTGVHAFIHCMWGFFHVFFWNKDITMWHKLVSNSSYIPPG